MTRTPQPDFLLVGAPKAGTTALHAALAQHPEVLPYVTPGWRPALLGPVVRAGARLGQFAPPRYWRRASAPLVAMLAGDGAARRPSLTSAQRERLLPGFAEDIALLSQLTGQDFSDWLSTADRGSFLERQAAGTRSPRTTVMRSWAPSGRATST